MPQTQRCKSRSELGFENMQHLRYLDTPRSFSHLCGIFSLHTTLFLQLIKRYSTRSCISHLVFCPTALTTLHWKRPKMLPYTVSARELWCVLACCAIWVAWIYLIKQAETVVTWLVPLVSHSHLEARDWAAAQACVCVQARTLVCTTLSLCPCPSLAKRQA